MRTLWSAGLLLVLGCGAFAVPGRACRKHDECAGLEAGYCSRAEICTRECTESYPCPENAACVAQGKRLVCLPTCETDAGCFAGFTCREGVCQVTNILEPPAP